jgi:hypothetical protein
MVSYPTKEQYDSSHSNLRAYQESQLTFQTNGFPASKQAYRMQQYQEKFFRQASCASFSGPTGLSAN